MTTIRDSTIYDSLPVLESWYREQPPVTPRKTKPCNNKRVSFRVEPSIISAKSEASYSLLMNQDDIPDYDEVSPSLCCHFSFKSRNRKSKSSFQKLDHSKKMMK